MPKSSTRKTDIAALSGAVMVDSYLGVLRIRKWPRKRGPKKSVQQQIQVDRFTAAQGLAKRAPGEVQADWIKATKGTDFYPRDIGTKMILNGPFEIELPDGTIQRPGRRELFAVSFQGFEVRLLANQAVGSGTIHNFTWPTPIRDTAGFFSPANPTFITVPLGVTVMEFFGGMQGSALSSGWFVPVIHRLNNNAALLAVGQYNGGWGGSIPTGPVQVQAGDQIAMGVQPQQARTAIPQTTYFSGTVLEASPV